MSVADFCRQEKDKGLPKGYWMYLPIKYTDANEDVCLHEKLYSNDQSEIKINHLSCPCRRCNILHSGIAVAHNAE